jgi:acetyl esterase/lipase
MSQFDHITKTPVVYTMPGVEAVGVRQVPYRSTDSGPLTLDVYYPPDHRDDARTPAVVFVTGFSDVGAKRLLGCTANEMASFVSWARLVAASGMVAVTYKNEDPVADAHAVLEHVRDRAATLGIDGDRLGVWSCSGHGPTALSVLTSGRAKPVRCAVLLCPYTYDADGATRTADASKQFGFVNAAAGRTAADLPRDLPLLIARGGQDQMPGLNEALDRFVAASLAANLPVTVVNHATGPHAFDVFDPSDTSREAIRQVLAFLRFHLVGGPR